MIKMIAGNGNSQAFSVPNKMLDNAPHLIKRGLTLVCENTRKEAIASTETKDKAGRIYYIKRGKNGKVYAHQSSAPGQSHAQITGSVTRSIQFNLEGTREARFGYDTATIHGKFLETGTNKMKARPTLKNAIEKKYIENQNIFKQACNIDKLT